MTVGLSTIDVLLTTEGTYPTGRGGVSTWCDLLVRGVPGVRYHVYTLIGHPHVGDQYHLPTGVKVTRVPMWGTEDPSEHLDTRYSLIFDRKLRTNDRVVQQEFLPLFDRLLSSVWEADPDGREIGSVMHQLHQFFQQFDYMDAFKSERVWRYYLDGFRQQRWAKMNQEPTLVEALQTLGWLYRFLVVLNTPVPRVDVTHSSAAAFCGLPGMLAKLDRKTPFLLTEHGVYLREQYLSIGRSGLSPFSKQFLLGLVRNVTAVNYAYADLVAPVAAFNARWERRLGVAEEQVRVIYNGVDPGDFAPKPCPREGQLTVVSVARIDPVKDIETLLRAAALVCGRMPQVKFVVYGSVSVPAYYERCLALRAELGLQAAVIFAGHVNDAPAAYAAGDLVALSSITEGFPYAVIEAMMAGRPVVATDVGGTREACEGVGLLVPPQDPQAMADAICRLLEQPDLRASLGQEGRERALNYFTIQRNIQLYRQAYGELADRARLTADSTADQERRLALHRGQALAVLGQHAEAIAALREAVDAAPGHPGTPMILLMIAEVYRSQGQLESCRLERERAEALAAFIRQSA